RRTQCKNQLKQIGLAINTYESGRGEFPPGGVAYGGYANGQGQLPQIPPPFEFDGEANGTNWAIESLPFLGEQPLYDLYDQGLENDQNRAVIGAYIPAMDCPSNNTVVELDTVSQNWAKGSYKAISGVMFPRHSSRRRQFLIWSRPAGGNGNFTGSWFADWKEHRGVFPVVHPTMKPTRAKQVTDGFSKTYAVGEHYVLPRRGGLDADDLVRWARTRRHSNKVETNGDPLLRQPDEQLCVDNVDIDDDAETYCDRILASAHAGDGANWLRLDGSVDFVSSALDRFVFEAFLSIAGDDEYDRNRFWQ
ncbi:MAG: DUF1559 domain-containing protein, partial [Planctomycetota bacterium]